MSPQIRVIMWQLNLIKNIKKSNFKCWKYESEFWWDAPKPLAKDSANSLKQLHLWILSSASGAPHSSEETKPSLADDFLIVTSFLLMVLMFCHTTCLIFVNIDSVLVLHVCVTVGWQGGWWEPTTSCRSSPAVQCVAQSMNTILVNRFLHKHDHGNGKKKCLSNCHQ